MIRILFVLIAALLTWTEAIAQAPPRMSMSDTVLINMDRATDVKYVHLDLSITPDTEYVAGSALIRAQIVEPTNRMVLSIRPQLKIDSVKNEAGDTLRYDRISDKVLIQLPRPFQPGEMTGVRVFYHGFSTEPDRHGFIHTTQDGTPGTPTIVWTASEPYGAKNWWPVKDNPSDKIDSVDLWFTCRTPNMVASNGLLVEVVPSGDTGRTYKWKHRYPIAHYLVAFSCTQYDTLTTYWKYSDKDSLMIQNFVYPGQVEHWRSALNIMPSILTTFTDWFGPYPFLKEKYGHAQWRGGGMENQTISFVNNTDTSILAHEAAHQWWGDAITCMIWNDLWVNEGFATYFTSRYFGVLKGDRWHNEDMARLERSITSEPGGSVFIPEDSLADTRRVFSGRLTYEKGAWVLHMLRHHIGDSLFRIGIKSFMTGPLRYSNAGTPHIIAHFNQVTGRDLQQFFDQWVFQEGFPIYQMNVQIAPLFNEWRTMITLDQTPSTGSTFFRMPVHVRIEGDGWDSLMVLDHTQHNQNWDFMFAREPKRVVFDPFNYILDGRVEQYLNVEESAKEVSVLLQPNPARDLLRVTLGEDLHIISYEIIDVRGHVITRDSAMKRDANAVIPVRGLPAGAYSLRLRVGNDLGTTFERVERFLVE
jgi:aminopeptidase N